MFQIKHNNACSAGLSIIELHSFSLSELSMPDRGPDVNEHNLRINYATIDGLIILYDYLIMKEASNSSKIINEI